MALLGAYGALSQSSSSHPLGDFLGGVNSAVDIIQSASASVATVASAASSSSTAASSSSPSAAQTSPTSSPSAAAAPSKQGSSNKTLIIAVVCAVVGALLLALLLLGCCLIRRRRKARKARAVTPPPDDEINSWKSEKPQNPGRTYIPSQYGRVPSAEHVPTIPPMAAGGRGSAPHIDTHPAYRPENPFVPVPPSPRRLAPNSRSGMTDGTVAGDAPYVVPADDPEKQRLRSRSRSHSRSRAATETGSAHNLPTHANPDRPSTPFGLSGIGQPYEDMHVHVLQNDAPSQALRQSLNDHDPLMSAQPHGPNAGYSTQSDVRRGGQSTDSPYTTASDRSNSTLSTPSDEFRASYGPANSILLPSQPYSHRLNYDPPSQQQKPQPLYTSQSQYPPTTNDRSSSSPSSMQPPPLPWGEPTEQRRQSPTRKSAQWAESGRRASRSPATSINGQPRRLRFSDIQASQISPAGVRDSRYGHSSHAQGGVGEAM